MARTNTKAADKEKAMILERQMQALELRKMGLSYRAIGAKLTISHEQARQDVEGELKSLAKARDGKLEEYRQLELERLDHIMKSLDSWVSSGNPQAVMAYLKAMDRRAKLLGLDAPLKQENHDEVKIVIRREDHNAAYTIPAPGRHSQSFRTLQNRSDGAESGQDDTGEAIH